jgi:predicted ATPase
VITRIEIDGFKTFRKFQLNVGPFLAVLGPNATGKSNLFDAIQFLRRVTEDGLTVAVRDARGDVDDLFRRRGDGSRDHRLTFAVEVLLEPTVRDPWGTEARLTQTRVRYELTVARREVDGNARLFVEYERAQPLPRGHRDLVKVWRINQQFAESHILSGKSRGDFLSTGQDERQGRAFEIRQDGVQGKIRRMPAESAEATVLSSMSSVEFKHLYALKQEISSWRFLQLEPHALRQPGESFGEDRLLPDGSNLARVLNRIERETATDLQPRGVMAQIGQDLAALIPGIRGVRVRENEQTRKFEVHLQTLEQPDSRADVASDGTLRVLALLAALYDPKHRGLICFEEPENGVHPFRLKRLVQYLRGLVTDPTRDDGVGLPLAQVIINSHSPVVLGALPDVAWVFVENQTVIESTETDGAVRRVKSRTSRFRRNATVTQKALLDDMVPADVSASDVSRFLTVAEFDEVLA